jgi:hypothetical protein
MLHHLRLRFFGAANGILSLLFCERGLIGPVALGFL